MKGSIGQREITLLLQDSCKKDCVRTQVIYVETHRTSLMGAPVNHLTWVITLVHTCYFNLLWWEDVHDYLCYKNRQKLNSLKSVNRVIYKILWGKIESKNLSEL